MIAADGVLVCIPARGGSKGVPGKNLRHVGGRSLVARAIAVGRQWLEAAGATNSRILVDTDAPAIGSEGAAHGAWVPFLREPAMAADDTTTEASVLRLLERLEQHAGWAPHQLMLLQPTSPLRTVGDLAACWTAFAATGHSAATVVALDHPWERAIRSGPDGTMQWAAGVVPSATRRQAYAPAAFVNGAVYCIGTATLRAEAAFITAGRTVPVPMPRWRSVDIDTVDDFVVAEALATRMSTDGDLT